MATTMDVDTGFYVDAKPLYNGFVEKIGLISDEICRKCDQIDSLNARLKAAENAHAQALEKARRDGELSLEQAQRNAEERLLQAQREGAPIGTSPSWSFGIKEQYRICFHEPNASGWVQSSASSARASPMSAIKSSNYLSAKH